MKIAQLFLIFFLSCYLLSKSYSQNSVIYLDIQSSQLKWVGKKITGEHTGEIKFKEGKIKFENNVFSQGVFLVDMNTVTTTDLQGEWADKLIGHLKSEDFFNTQENPYAKLEINKGTQNNSNENEYSFEGVLTIKKISHPIQFDGIVHLENGVYKIQSTFDVDRTIYDIKYGSGKFFGDLGDKTIYDNFEVKVDVSLK